MRILTFLFLALAANTLATPEIATSIAEELPRWAGGNTLDVRRFGAKADSQRVNGAVTIAASSTVTCATANFSASDVGKQIWGMSPGGILRISRTVITSVVSSTEITIDIAATGSASDVTLIYGTDDTAALQAATAAAKAMPTRGMVHVPAGGYIFTGLPFDFGESAVGPACSLVGDGSNCVVFYPVPDFNFGSSTTNTGIFARYNGNSREGRIEGVRIEGQSYAMVGSGFYVISDSGNKGTFRDIRIEHIRGVTAHLALAGSDFLVDRCHFEGSSYLGVSVAGGGYIVNSYTGNHAYHGLSISGIGGEGNTGLHLSVMGCIIDECASDSCNVANSSDVKFTNTRFFGPVGKYACTVGGTSKARFVNCEVIDYGNTGNRGGLKVLAGGAAFLSSCRLHGCGTLYGLDNEGTVYDGGNNETNSKTGSAISASPAL